MCSASPRDFKDAVTTGVALSNTVEKNKRLYSKYQVARSPECTREMLLANIRTTLRIYNKAGIRVSRIHADPEFECVKEELEANNEVDDVNIYPARSHVPEIKRLNRVIKERF